MHFDDRLATVLRHRAAGERAARTQFRQLLDLLGERPQAGNPSLRLKLLFHWLFRPNPSGRLSLRMLVAVCQGMSRRLEAMVLVGLRAWRSLALNSDVDDAKLLL